MSESSQDTIRALSALNAIDPDCDRKTWVKLAAAAKDAGLSLEDFDEWSKTGTSYGGASDTRAAWKSVKEGGEVTESTLFYMAKQAGWTDSDRSAAAKTVRARKPTAPKKAAKERDLEREYWKDEADATATGHDYITRKKGQPDGLKVIVNDVKGWAGVDNLRGFLMVPARENGNGKILNIQMISPDGKTKINAYNSTPGGFFIVGKMHRQRCVYIVEGIGHAWAVNGATITAKRRACSVVAFGDANLEKVADKLIAGGYQRIAIIPDRGKEADVAKWASAKGLPVCNLPDTLPPGADVGDLWLEHGDEAVKSVLMQVKNAPAVEPSKVDAGETSAASNPAARGLNPATMAATWDTKTPDSVRADTFEILHAGEFAHDAESGAILKNIGGVWRCQEKNIIERVIDLMHREAGVEYGIRNIEGTAKLVKMRLPNVPKEMKGVIPFENGRFNVEEKTFISGFDPAEGLRTTNGIVWNDEEAQKQPAAFHKYINRAGRNRPELVRQLKAALYMIATNRYKWQLFIEITGQGGSGKSLFQALAKLLVGDGNHGSASIENLDGRGDKTKTFSLVNKRLIVIPDQVKYKGDAGGLMAITGGDAIGVRGLYVNAADAVIPAVVLIANNAPCQFTGDAGAVERRRVLFNFPDPVPEHERDPQLIIKLKRELPAIFRDILDEFKTPDEALEELVKAQKSEEAEQMKAAIDPMREFVRCFERVSIRSHGMSMGMLTESQNHTRPRVNIYHAWLCFYRANGGDMHRPVMLNDFVNQFKRMLQTLFPGLPEDDYIGKKIKGIMRYMWRLKEEPFEWLPEKDREPLKTRQP
ncbi:TPA: PriCT-2 domain-containing protein [Klebsiella pneumoniae]|nr:PriCT-2 domain-containing protein [Klebsiella pneumoniae]